VSVGVLRGAANAIASNAQPQPVVRSAAPPTAAPPVSPTTASVRSQPTRLARADSYPLPVKSMKFFPTSRGPIGVFNPDHAEPFMEGNSLVNTNEQGVPLGQVMVPVEGQPRAQIGVMAGGRYDPNAGPALPYRVKPTTTHDPYTPSYVSEGTQEIAAKMAAEQAEREAPRLAAGQRAIARMEAAREDMGQGILAPRNRIGNAGGERFVYETVTRPQQSDATARAIALQSEVNKGVMAQQEAKERLAEIGVRGRVDAADTSGRWRFEAAQTAAEQKTAIEKDKLELAKRHQAMLEKFGGEKNERAREQASNVMLRDYAEERGRIIGNPNTSDREKRDALDALNSVFEDYIDTSTGKPKQREVAPAAPAGQPAATGPMSWQNKYRPRG
jgi:hypothetical protein